MRIIYLYISFLTKGATFLSLLYVCLICRAIFHHQYSVSIFSEFLRIVRFTLRLTNSVPKASQLYARTITQGRNKAQILRQIKKSIPNIPWNIFQVLSDIKPINKRNNYVLKSKLQLGWQKIRICMDVGVCTSVYIRICINIYKTYEINLLCIRM